VSELIHVKGLSDLQKLLDGLPAKIEQNVLRGALRAGAAVVLDKAKADCPVGVPNSENVRLYGGYEGALRDSIRLSVRAKGGTVTASIKAGGKSKKTKADVFYAHIVEYGAAAHLIKPQKGGWLSFLGIFAKSVQHPGIAPKPFLRGALDSRATAAVVAAAEYMKKRLATKQGLDTSDITIEADA